MVAQDVWFNKICESYLNPSVFYEGKRLPSFPSDTIQANTTGQSGVNTLKEAFLFYKDCIETFNELGVPMNPQHNLLDFGVGWGRIARFFLRELPLQNIYGVDVVDDFINICKETFRSDNFYVCKPFPPTWIPDGKMDYIVGYSVFSHLSEEACFLWMNEFHRLLSDDGVVALTTRGRWFFDYCENLKETGDSGYLHALSNLFDDFTAARSAYDNGKFVHSNKHGVTGGGAMIADFYGESFIPELYAKTAYSEKFKLEKFSVNSSHPIMFFRKKKG